MIEMRQTCGACGKSFPAPRRSGRRRKYCSAGCRQFAFRNEIEKNRKDDPQCGALRNSNNSQTISATHSGENRSRGFSVSTPVDLLGHACRGPSGLAKNPLDRETIRKIVHCEVGGDVGVLQ
jgi:hypothetical protein